MTCANFRLLLPLVPLKILNNDLPESLGINALKIDAITVGI